MLRACEAGPRLHYVPAGETQLLRIEPTGPTAGRRVYACHEHIRAQGLVPVAAASVEHRTAAAARESQSRTARLPRICGDQILLPISLLLGALQMETEPGAAELDDVTEDPACTLQHHHAGAHHGLVLSLAGATTGAVWAVWTPLTCPRLMVIPDCPEARDDGMRGCCQYLGHPGGHTWEVHDPLQAAVQQAMARLPLPPRRP